MKVSDLIFEDSIFFLEVKNKDELFEKIAEIISDKNREIESKENLLSLMKAREKQGNTFARKEVAIPHVKCKFLKNFKIYLFIIKNGIEYKEDEEKVKIVFMIIGPDKNYNIHLLLLSRIARLIKETSVIKEILNKQDSGIIHSIISENERKII
jgi:PTS system nitrogen regulatory IIA component